MSDEANKPDEAQPTGTDPAPEKAESQVEAPTEKLLSQSQVDEIVKREKAKTERRVRKELEEAGTASKKPESKPEAKSDPVAELMAKVAFSEALEDLDWKPSKEDRETLRDMFLAKGADAMERLANRLKPAPVVQAAPVVKKETAEAPAAAPKSAVVTPGAPAAVPVNPADIHPTQLTSGDIERMRQDGTFLSYLNRNGGGGGLSPFSKRMPK